MQTGAHYVVTEMNIVYNARAAPFDDMDRVIYYDIALVDFKKVVSKSMAELFFSVEFQQIVFVGYHNLRLFRVPELTFSMLLLIQISSKDLQARISSLIGKVFLNTIKVELLIVTKI